MNELQQAVVGRGSRTVLLAGLLAVACSQGGKKAAAGGAASSGAAAASSDPVKAPGAAASAGQGVTPVVPAAPAICPKLVDGTITVLGQEVRIWTGPALKPGPLVFYWHGTNSLPEEALLGVGGPLNEIRASGGLVASFSTTTAKGTTTGNEVWYTGDFEMADIVLACGVQQGLVDARQVYTAGCSAGGLQAGAMVYARSSYLAAAMPNSGGIVGRPTLQDSAHVPALITTHGGPADVVVISFAESSAQLGADIRRKGGFVVNCNHGAGHCQSPLAVLAAQWQFAKAHPFGVASPYAAGLPAGFPDVCEIVR